MKHIFEQLKRLISQESIDRTISGGISKQFKLLTKIIISILTIIFILILCLNIQVSYNGTIIDQLWIIYNNFIDSGNLISQMGVENRIAMVITNLLGSILLGGIFISMCSNIIERRVETIRTGKAYYKSISNHYVIIGYSNITISLIKELHKENPNAKIIIMSSKNSEIVRHNLQAQLNKKEENNVYIYFGNIDSLEELNKLNIKQAKEVYILGDEGDYGRDSKNIQCVHNISILRGMEDLGDRLHVYTQLDKLSAYNVIQKLDIMHNFNNANIDSIHKLSNIYFRPFNLYENWARKLWSIYAIDNEYDKLDYHPIAFQENDEIKNINNYVHLVIVGFNRMGQALMLEALRVCHFANYNDSINSELRVRTNITVVDKNIDYLRESFHSQYPFLEEQIDDIKINYINEDLTNRSLRNKLIEWSEIPQQMLTIAICISDPDESICLGLNLPGEIYKSDARVLIRQEIRTDLGWIVHMDNRRFKNVKVFGMLEDCIAKNMLYDEIPAYVNQEYEDRFNSKFNKKEFIKSLYRYVLNNDKEMLEKEITRARNSWINLEENMRWANRYQVDAYMTFINTLGYKICKEQHDEQNSVTPEEFERSLTEKKLLALMQMEKYRWNAERTIEGWKYGPNRDDIYRTHPLIIPFSKLSDDEKVKDKIVIENLPYLMILGGYNIYSPKHIS